jgi:spore germination protein KB
LSALTTYAPIITSTPQGVRDSWLAAILAGSIALGMTLLACWLGEKFPRQTIFQYCEIICGKLIGKIIGLTLICFFIYYTALSLRMFTEFVLTTMLPGTPLIVLTLVAMGVTAYMVRNGLEAIGRFTEIIGPPLLLLFPVLLISEAPKMHLYHLLPIMEDGIKPVVIHSLTPIGIFGEAVWIVLLALPGLNKPETIKRAVFFGFLFNIFMVSSVAAAIIAIFGPTVAGQLFFPAFSMVRMISIADSLERLEAVLSILFIVNMFIKTGFFFYASLIGTMQWLKCKEYKPLVLPLAVVITSLSMFIVRNIMGLKDFYAPQVFVPFVLTMEAGLPLLLTIVVIVRTILPRGFSGLKP